MRSLLLTTLVAATASVSAEEGPFVWSRPVDVDVPAGVFRFRMRSLVKATVHVEAFRLECDCE